MIVFAAHVRCELLDLGFERGGLIFAGPSDHAALVAGCVDAKLGRSATASETTRMAPAIISAEQGIEREYGAVRTAREEFCRIGFRAMTVTPKPKPNYPRVSRNLSRPSKRNVR